MATLGERDAGEDSDLGGADAARRGAASTVGMGFDPRTGLPDRALFRDRMVQASIGGVREGRLTAVLCLGIDDLSGLDERHGRACVERALELLSERLAGNVRGTDTVTRLDREEFGVVQVGLGRPQDGYRLVKRLLDLLASPVEVGDQTPRFSFNAGIALVETEAQEPEAWLQEARLARQKARADGAGAWRCADPELDAILLARQRLEEELLGSLAGDQLELHYQPIVEMTGRRIAGFEALLRWRHPEHGLLEPAGFLDVAEDSGIVGDIGKWVLARACTDAVRWPRPIKLAVDLFAGQFQRGDPVAAVEAALITSGLEPGRLELEITEDALMTGDAPALNALQRLHDRGIAITMDRFGTGPSSLSLLRAFPFDRVKIDGTWIAHLGGGGVELAMVRAVIRMCRCLDLRVAAEGVEGEDQMELLRAEGCDRAQGACIGPPLPADALPGMLARLDRPEAVDRPHHAEDPAAPMALA